MRKTLLLVGLGLVMAAPLAIAQVAQSEPVQIALEWDDIEDAAERVGGKIEEGWETVEDTVIPETEEERREEAQERREDAAEEAEEERQKARRRSK